MSSFDADQAAEAETNKKLKLEENHETEATSQTDIVDQDEAPSEDSKQQEATATTTTTTTTSTTETENEVPETTIFCDACGKARIVPSSRLSEFDMKLPWVCSLARPEGCEFPDDEIINIAGEMFGKVLDLCGIKTRRLLANSEVGDFEAGPWVAYLEDWISTARNLELHDAMEEIFETEDPEVVTSFKEVAEIFTPLDVLKLEPNEIKLLLDGILEAPMEDVDSRIVMWQQKATELVQSMNWLH